MKVIFAFALIAIVGCQSQPDPQLLQLRRENETLKAENAAVKAERDSLVARKGYSLDEHLAWRDGFCPAVDAVLNEWAVWAYSFASDPEVGPAQKVARMRPEEKEKWLRSRMQLKDQLKQMYSDDRNKYPATQSLHLPAIPGWD